MDFINIYILQDCNILSNDISRLSTLLTGEKRIRFINAIKEETKRKIIYSTLLSYYTLRHHGIKKEIAQKVFNTSDYLINIKEIYHSNSHSKKVYIQVIAKDSIAVDIEKYINRPNNVYELLHSKTKSEFYYKWLKKECVIKIGNEENKFFRVFFYKDYIYGIMSNNQKIKKHIVSFKDITNQLKQDKLFF